MATMTKVLNVPKPSPKGLIKNPLVRYLSESRSELTKVIWPTRSQALKLSGIVFGSAVAIGTFLTLVDLGLAKAVDQLIKL